MSHQSESFEESRKIIGYFVQRGFNKENWWNKYWRTGTAKRGPWGNLEIINAESSYHPQNWGDKREDIRLQECGSWKERPHKLWVRPVRRSLCSGTVRSPGPGRKEMPLNGGSYLWGGALVGCCWYASEGAGGWGEILQWGTSDGNSKRREVFLPPLTSHAPSCAPYWQIPTWTGCRSHLQSVVCRVLAPTPDESRTEFSHSFIGGILTTKGVSRRARWSWETESKWPAQLDTSET